MKRSILLTLGVMSGMILACSAYAQNGVAIAGWYPLPDSLFLIWDLEQDQVRRIRVIEEDHNADRAEILAETGLNENDRRQRLEQLASERRKEVKAVLQVKQFEDWERRSIASGGR